MDDVDRLVAAFRARPRAPAVAKLDVVRALERLQDPRVVAFLLRLLTHGHEPVEVRLHVLKWSRNRHLAAGFRLGAARAFLLVLARRSAPELRLEAAIALAEFTDVEGVPAALGRVALDTTELLDLRYSAFTSLERAGPTPAPTHDLASGMNRARSGSEVFPPGGGEGRIHDHSSPSGR
jgi:hypothetical protein